MEAQSASLKQVPQQILTVGTHILLFSNLLPVPFVCRMVYLTCLTLKEFRVISEIHNIVCYLEYVHLKINFQNNNFRRKMILKITLRKHHWKEMYRPCLFRKICYYKWETHLQFSGLKSAMTSNSEPKQYLKSLCLKHHY